MATPTPRRAAALEELAARVERLTPDKRLELAAKLVAAGDYTLAEPIARRVADELAAVLLLTKGGR